MKIMKVYKVPSSLDGGGGDFQSIWKVFQRGGKKGEKAKGKKKKDVSTKDK